MKVNYNAKTGNNILLNNGMGCQGEFYVADTYPEGVKLMFGDRKISLTYEELKAMDAEFVMSKVVTQEDIDQLLISYVTEFAEAVDVLWKLCAIATNKQLENQEQEDCESTLKWVELQNQLRAIVDP